LDHQFLTLPVAVVALALSVLLQLLMSVVMAVLVLLHLFLDHP
jgi:hypothetical protein